MTPVPSLVSPAMFQRFQKKQRRSQRPMAVPTGRSDKRIPKKMAVELVPPDAPHVKEAATAQNVSARGMRVTTEHVLHPGKSVVLSHPQSGFRIKARVIYCQRIEKDEFAVGLELEASPGEWAESR
jgi:PilZ domain